MIFKDIITKKLSGGKLTKAEIDFFVSGLRDMSLPEEQIAALAMAIAYEGMDLTELCRFTKALANSGDVISWDKANLPGPVVDEHSARGIGDKTPLILAPIMAACGGFSPIVSTRGFGTSLGSADKLESIPDYKIDAPLKMFRQTVRNIGCAFMAQTEKIAPADRRLYAIRSMTGSFFSFPLIAASILAKKIAGGSRHLVVNMKIGTGALLKDLNQGQEFAALFKAVAAKNNIKAELVFSDLHQILGRSIGCSLELTEAIEFLIGKNRDPALAKAVMTIGCKMLVLCGLAATENEASLKIDNALSSGEAAEKFSRMVAMCSGHNDFLENYQRIIPKAPIVRPVFSTRQGYISDVNIPAIEKALATLGSARYHKNEDFNHAAGLSGCHKPGDFINRETPLLFVHTNSESAFQEVRQNISSLFVFSDEKPQAPSSICGV